MKHTRAHYFFAEGRPTVLWLETGRVLGLLLEALACHPTLALFGDWSGIPLFIGSLLLGVLIGYFAAILVGFFVLGPLYSIRSVDNGEPFWKGDLIHILVGPHRDRI